MKIKVPDGLIIIDILTLLLVLTIVLIPSDSVRVILGLPFLLFFPGYALTAALFFRKENTEAKAGLKQVERIALSFGMSIAVVALIGFCLNFTPWGIRILPVMWSIAGFILVMSGIAFIRRSGTHQSPVSEIHLKMPGWEGSALNKFLSVFLMVAVLGTVGMLFYTISNPKIGERFSEFYILGNGGKAENYPAVFTMRGQNVINIKYGNGAASEPGSEGKVTLGIVNHEQQPTSYVVAIFIDGQQVNILYNGILVRQLSDIQLLQGEKWEQRIGFAPLHTGDKQKVEFFLYTDGASEPEYSLHLWIDVQATP